MREKGLGWHGKCNCACANPKVLFGKGSILDSIMSGDFLEEQCKKACEQLNIWREAKDRALAQLNSIHNLVGQLETLHQCSHGGVADNLTLGVVREHPLCVQLLEAKLVQAMERAYSSALKEK
jgi:hypothetical protein